MQGEAKPYVDPFDSANAHEKRLREANLNAERAVKNGQPSGISRRDYFAAAAMQGLLSFDDQLSADAMAALAVKFADRIIFKLDEEKK